MLEETKRVINNNPRLRDYINNHYFGQNGLNSPVDRNLMPTAPASEIVFDENTARNLFKLAKKTHDQNCEYSFILIGYKDKSKTNRAYIKGFFEHNSNVYSRKAAFDSENLRLVDLVTQKKSSYDVMFVCHTHPDRGAYYMNFSLGDLDGVVSLYEDNKNYFLIDDYGEGILTGDGQVLFAFYDPRTKNVYKFGKYLVNPKNTNLVVPFDDFMNQLSHEEQQNYHQTNPFYPRRR